MELKPGYIQTEIGVVPEEWQVKELAAISERIMVGIASAATHAYRARGVPLLRNQNIKAGYLDDRDVLYVDRTYEEAFRNKRLKAGDLLTARTGYPGMSCVVPHSYDAGQSFTTLITRPNSDLVDSQYLCQFVNSSAGQAFFERSQIGGAQKNVNAGTLRGMPVPVPPLPEQKAIAAALSDVDALIGALDRFIAKKRDLKQAAMQQLLSGQTRLPGFISKPGHKQSEIGVIPEDWEVKPLLSVLRIANGQVDPKVEPYRSMTLVAPDHIESATGRLLDRKTAAEQRAISGKYIFARGDIVYSKIRPYLRKAVLAEFDGLCSADMYPLKPVGDVSAGFMLAVLLGHRFTRFAETVSVRSGMPKINRAELAEFSLALPPPAEQRAIATVLADMGVEIAALEQRRDKTRLLKQGMMQELLTGRTRLV